VPETEFIDVIRLPAHAGETNALDGIETGAGRNGKFFEQFVIHIKPYGVTIPNGKAHTCKKRLAECWMNRIIVL